MSSSVLVRDTVWTAANGENIVLYETMFKALGPRTLQNTVHDCPSARAYSICFPEHFPVILETAISIHVFVSLDSILNTVVQYYNNVM